MQFTPEEKVILENALLAYFQELRIKSNSPFTLPASSFRYIEKAYAVERLATKIRKG